MSEGGVPWETGGLRLKDRTESLSRFEFVPADVLDCMDRISRAGFEVWLVGGALRDFFMGLPTKDWDLATTASPAQVMEIFPKVIPVGIRFGTVAVHTPERDVEVTSCHAPGREGIAADLNRRDFTVNALGLSYPGGGLLDLNGGMNDLATHTLRGVGDARERFREDRLRVLRACRFVSVSGFSIHRGTLEAMKYEAHGLEQVAKERIRDEVVKILLGSRVVRGFEVMKRTGVLKRVLPELDAGFRKRRGRDKAWDVFHHTLYTVRYCPARRRVRLAALFHGISRPFIRRSGCGGAERSIHRKESACVAADVMRRWRMSRREIRDVAILVESQLEMGPWREPEMRLLFGRLGMELLGDLMDLERAKCAFHASRKSMSQRLDWIEERFARMAGARLPAGIGDLAVSGKDVMEALGLPQGPHIGKILEVLLYRVLDDSTLNDYEQLMRLLRDADEFRDGHFGRR